MYFEKLVKAFSKLEEVEAIALGGSRAGEKFDKTSDYDLYIYCTSVPQESRRTKILEETCQYTEIGNSFWELEDDCTLKDGIDIDILYRNVDDFASELHNVVDEGIAYNGYTTCMWHNLIHSKILYDATGRFSELQKKYQIPYPSKLRENIIKKNFRLLTNNLPSYDRQIKKAVARRDLTSMNHRTSAFMESYFDIIFALNELTHPGEKRMITYASEQAKLLPKDFEENINKLFSDLFGNPDEVPSDLSSIINNLEDIIDLSEINR